MDSKPNVILDASGLVCPLPAVKTALTLEKMATGEMLEVITTDQVSKSDLPLWCRQTGNELVEVLEANGAIHIFIRKLTQ